MLQRHVAVIMKGTKVVIDNRVGRSSLSLSIVNRVINAATDTHTCIYKHNNTCDEGPIC